MPSFAEHKQERPDMTRILTTPAPVSLAAFDRMFELREELGPLGPRG